MNNVHQFIKPQVKEAQCSFCARAKSEVPGELLIGQEGGRARICADCAKHAAQRIAETPDAS